MSDELEAIKASIAKRANWFKWGGGIAVAVVLAPVIWLAAYAVLGVAALGASLGIAAVVGLVLVNGWPVLVDKVRNAKIAAIIAEAKKNPIPTLWAGHKNDALELTDMSHAIEDYATEIGNVESKMKSLTRDLGPEDLESFKTDIAAMRGDLELQEEDYRNGMRDLAAQEVQIKRASAIWDMNMAMTAANAKNVNRAEETMAKIRRDTALDSVAASMNRSKAQLRARILNRTAVQGVSAPPALTHQPADVIDMVPSAAKQAVPILHDNAPHN